MTILIEEECEIPFTFDYKKIARDVIGAALDQEQCPYEAEISLTLTDNDSIHQVNKEFRNIDRPTDVLSFPMAQYPSPADFDALEEEDDIFNPDTGELILGDIMISVDKVVEQADAYGHSQLREYAFLIAHSMLHLMGYDHVDDPEGARIMEERQNLILDSLKIYR